MVAKTAPKQSPKSPTPAPVDALAIAGTITLAKHHAEMNGAFSLGSDCINRISTMIDAALQIASGANPPTASIHLLKKFLKECQYFSEDLAGLMECERDTQAQLANEEEGK